MKTYAFIPSISVATVLCLVLCVWAAQDPSAAKRPTSEPAGEPASRAASGPASQPTTQAAKVKDLIADLSSDDGDKRTAATKALFAMGIDAVKPLEKAGAVQITPRPAGAKGGRLDLVYSLVQGLQQNADQGYRTDFFLLQVEKNCTAEDVRAMGKRCGFTLNEKGGVNDGYCGVFTVDGIKFADILKAVLTGEPKVITVGLTYFSKHPVP